MQAIIGKQFPQVVIPLIDKAQKSIWIVVYDWRWYPNDPGHSVQLFNQAIIRAVRRGVKVSAVVNHKNILSVLRTNGIEAVILATKNIVHAKLMIIDDDILIIGSHNYTHSAFTHNLEISAVLPGCSAMPEFRKFFTDLFTLYERC